MNMKTFIATGLFLGVVCMNAAFATLNVRNGTAVIPNNVTTIAPMQFKSQSALIRVEFQAPSQVREIKGGAFSKSGLKRIFIPATVKIIHSGAFKYCSDLIYVEFAKGSRLESVADDAFSGCGGLAEMVVPPEWISHFKKILPRQVRVH